MHKRIVNEGVIENPLFSLFLPGRDRIVRRPLVEHVPLVWRDEHAVAEAGEQPARRASTLILEALSGGGEGRRPEEDAALSVLTLLHKFNTGCACACLLHYTSEQSVPPPTIPIHPLVVA